MNISLPKWPRGMTTAGKPWLANKIKWKFILDLMETVIILECLIAAEHCNFGYCMSISFCTTSIRQVYSSKVLPVFDSNKLSVHLRCLPSISFYEVIVASLYRCTKVQRALTVKMSINSYQCSLSKFRFLWCCQNYRYILYAWIKMNSQEDCLTGRVYFSYVCS